ncbi:MAG: hypothetical protein ACI857_001960 [Arenicella sp.]|jgi:hypothetical protein
MEKPTPEAKALSLYLMAFKATKPECKQQAKHINRQWDRFRDGELSLENYTKEIQELLTLHGGYAKVVENTVWHYIKTTGEWTLKGDDKYCEDAQKVADKVLEK